VQAYQLLVSTPDAAALSAAVSSVRGVAGVDAVSESSVAIGGTSSIVASYHGDASALRAALMASGWSVDYEGGQLRLSRAAGPRPVPAPPRVDPLAPAAAPPPPRP
jgi:hypothetical protein